MRIGFVGNCNIAKALAEALAHERDCEIYELKTNSIDESHWHASISGKAGTNKSDRKRNRKNRWR